MAPLVDSLESLRKQVMCYSHNLADCVIMSSAQLLD